MGDTREDILEGFSGDLVSKLAKVEKALAATIRKLELRKDSNAADEENLRGMEAKHDRGKSSKTKAKAYEHFKISSSARHGVGVRVPSTRLSSSLAVIPETKEEGFYDQFTVNDLLRTVGKNESHKKQLLCLSNTDHATKALQEMERHNVLSLAVENGEGRVCGVISVTDIIAALLVSPLFERHDSSAGGKKVTSEDIESVLRNRNIFDIQIGKMMGKSEEQSRVVWDDDDLGTLVTELHKGCHRVLVSSRQHHHPKRTPSLVSQLDVLKFIRVKARSHPELAGCLSQTLHDAIPDLTRKKITCMNERDSALSGFRLLWQDFDTAGKDGWFSALPILDAKGTVVGTLSHSDFRGINPSNVTSLQHPVLKFLRQKSKSYWVRSPEVATGQMKLGEAIDKMLETGVHRLWIVAVGKENYKPKGVLSMADAIRATSGVPAESVILEELGVNV